MISFINLLDTSTTWVDIFWMSLNLAKDVFQECIVFLMMEYVSLKMEISLSFVYVMRPGSGEDPKLQGTLKNASYLLTHLNYSPTKGGGGVQALQSSPG